MVLRCHWNALLSDRGRLARPSNKRLLINIASQEGGKADNRSYLLYANRATPPLTQLHIRLSLI
jgi:hypothetical protein